MNKTVAVLESNAVANTGIAKRAAHQLQIGGQGFARARAMRVTLARKLAGTV